MPSDVLGRSRVPLKWFELPVFRQVLALVWFSLWLITLLALFSYDPNDLASSEYPPNSIPSNFIGWLGANLAWALYWGFGFGSYLVCFMFFWFFLVNVMSMPVRWLWKPLYVAVFITTACSILDLQHNFGWDWIAREANVDVPGGLLGSAIIDATVPALLNQTGAAIIFGTLFFLSVLFLFDLNPKTSFLNAFSLYRMMRARSEERAYLRASEKDRLLMQEKMLKKMENDALEDLRRAATVVKPVEKDERASNKSPDLLPILVEAKKRETTRILESLPRTVAAKARASETGRMETGLPKVAEPQLTLGDVISTTSSKRQTAPLSKIVPAAEAQPAVNTPSEPGQKLAFDQREAAPSPENAKPVSVPGPSVIRRPEPYSPPASREVESSIEEAVEVEAEPTPEPEFASKEIVIIPEHIPYMPAIIRPQPIDPQPALATPVVEDQLEPKRSDERFKAMEVVEDWIGRSGDSQRPETPVESEPLPEPEVSLTSSEAIDEPAYEESEPEPEPEQVLEPAIEPQIEPVPEPQFPAPAIVRATPPEPEIPRPAAPVVRSSIIHTQPPAEPRPQPDPNVLSSSTSDSDYILPDFDLLTQPDRSRNPGLTDDELRTNLALIVDTLRLFGVLAAPGDITPGATITRYEVYPAAGVRVDKISSLSKDLSRVLCAERINVLAPIPGKDSVGIEVPNSNKVAVFLRELLESKDWHTTTAKIPIALGKDVYGKTLVADLAAMPHMLIGGTTGSGKSVCINCILMSFLYRFTPEELRLILIDPKQVEMQVYNAIPHLVVPVVTDPKKVMLALKWVITEMEKRYQILAKVGVRNIATFNARKKELPRRPAEPQMELMGLDDSGDDEEDDQPLASQVPNVRVPREDDLFIPDRLPYIVVIVDELADLMQTAPADVESAIARLTAKARAAGIHLIVATQTPRREVVTGVIKTNIPARIAFQVPSGLDSRVILDENGAENLLGRGDLMYKPPGVGRLVRGQGAFVSDEEVAAVVKFCGDQAEAVYNEEIHNKLSGRTTENISEEDQKLILECFEVIRQEKRASTSNLQRRLRLGYNRAAYVIDFLERTGVLGAGEGAKPREILVDLDTYVIEF